MDIIESYLQLLSLIYSYCLYYSGRDYHLPILFYNALSKVAAPLHFADASKLEQRKYTSGVCVD